VKILGGRKTRWVGVVAGGRVEAVAAGSNCWELYCRWTGCGGSYELGCRGSLALVNEEGEASGACIGGACTNGACGGGACAGGACIGGACANGACAGRACVDGACAGGACADGACVGGACMGGACVGGAVVVAGVGRLGRGSSFKACGLIAFS
jgi:hypothetical protein